MDMFGEEMDNNFREALADYFDAWDLVDMLELKTEDIITAFEDVVHERMNELKDYIGYEENDNNDE